MVSAGQPKERRISGRVFILLLVLAVGIGVALTVGSLYINSSPTTTASLTGTLYVSDSGNNQNDTQGYSAVYNVSLAAQGGTGSLNVTLESGPEGTNVTTTGTTTTTTTTITGTDTSGQLHSYPVSNMVLSPYNLTLMVDGQRANLIWISNNTVWKPLNDSYVATWGQSVPSSQMRGSVNSSVLPGIPSGSYALLTLTISSQPIDNIPFAIGTIAVAPVHRSAGLTVIWPL